MPAALPTAAACCLLLQAPPLLLPREAGPPRAAAFGASSFLGGSGYDAVHSAALDSAGNIYVTGETGSADFPLTDGARGAAGRHAFVAKLAPDARTLLYSVFLSAAGNDSGRAIAVDDAGRACVAGQVSSPAFPVTAGAVRAAYGGLEDGFVACLDSNGGLVYATYLGGAATDLATAIALRDGQIYVAGYTNSPGFPVTAAAPQTALRAGSFDSFLAKLDPRTGTLLYSSLFGGSGSDMAQAVAVSAAGEACMAGRTDSDGLPAVAALRAARGGGGDAFLACLDFRGTKWTQVSYLGGASEDAANAIAIDASGNRHIAGTTFSPDFPSAPGAPLAAARDYDAFVAVLTPAGVLLRSTLIGGAGADTATALATASDDDWVAGYTASADFPATSSRPSGSDSYDGFACHLTNTGQTESCSRLGGQGDDRASGIAVRGSAVIVAGTAGSASFDVPAGFPEGAPLPYNGFIAAASTSAAFFETVSPASGAGKREAFTVTVAAPGGAATIGQVWLLVASTAAGASACNLVYSHATGSFSLLDDAGSAPAPGLSNSQCTLDENASGAVVSGSNLAATFSVRFSSAFAGTKNLFLRTAGTVESTPWHAGGTYTVTAENDAPAVRKVTPVQPGPNTGFEIAVNDQDGAAGIDWVLFLLDSGLTGVRACHALYRLETNLLYLADDAGASLLGPLTLGGSGTLSNSQCTLDASASRVSLSGGNLSLTLAFRFRPAFAGAKRMYVLASDRGLLSSGWQDMGGFTVPAGLSATARPGPRFLLRLPAMPSPRGSVRSARAPPLSA